MHQLRELALRASLPRVAGLLGLVFTGQSSLFSSPENDTHQPQQDTASRFPNTNRRIPGLCASVCWLTLVLFYLPAPFTCQTHRRPIGESVDSR
jgi:hypothetical protein